MPCFLVRKAEWWQAHVRSENQYWGWLCVIRLGLQDSPLLVPISNRTESFFCYCKMGFFSVLLQFWLLFPNNYSPKTSNAQFIFPIQPHCNILSVGWSFPVLRRWLQKEVCPWISKSHTEQVNALCFSSQHPVASGQHSPFFWSRLTVTVEIM